MNSNLPPPLIAVIGCDGSGKSTICEYLIVFVSKYSGAAKVHLGKQAGNVERWLGKLPVIGRFFSKAIQQKKTRVAKSHPDLLAAFVIMSFLLRRILRFRRMLTLRKRGMIIIADRFPQIQIPGAFDGPQLPSDIPGSPVIAWMAGREQAAFQWMTSYKPDLVIKLTVALDVACARKPDHRRDALAKKIAAMSLLTFEYSQVVQIDANQPLEDVLCAVEEAVANFMASKGYTKADVFTAGDQNG